MRKFDSPAELIAATGERLGVSAYRQIGQSDVDAFGDLTDDRQWIHVDVARAATGPFGSTIAHGFFVLSLLTAMLEEVVHVGNTSLLINKGLDKVRFHAPVPMGARVRGVIDLIEATARPRDFTEAVLGVTVEIEGSREPALKATQRLLYQRTQP